MATSSASQGVCDLPPATMDFLKTGKQLKFFGGRAAVLSSGKSYNSMCRAGTSGGVPEPATWLMFGAGLTTLAFLRKRG